jgi:undecaprenyl-phosphate 4-deoxy-4-formamido-L-arabinose transferase
MPGHPNCSIVVPVYNAEDTLEALVNRLSEVLPTIFQGYEVILVNDGSQDASWQVISELADEFTWIRGINLMRNYGQHSAILCGLRTAAFEIIITMDDDLQHPADQIQKLIDKLGEGYDVVYGYPMHEQHGLWRNLASQLTKLALQNSMGAQTARHISAFRALRTVLVQSFSSYQSTYVNIDVLLTWGTERFAAIPVKHDPRLAGESHYTVRKLILHAINMITGFSILPLQIASWMGFAFAFFGGLVLLYVLGRYLIQGGSVPGFPFLASTIAIFSGVQLFALGIIGEYIARMHFRLMDRPQYVIREMSGLEEAKNL